MKIIDLLNEIAKGNTPKKVKYDGDIYTLVKEEYGREYVHECGNNIATVMNYDIDGLNEEIEVIEDEAKRNN